MQRILGIDITGENVVAAIYAVEAESVSLVEYHELVLERNPEYNPVNVDINNPSTSYFTNLKQALKDATKQLQTNYSRCVVVVPPYNSLATDIELPFSNPKAIEKVLDLEVQDLVPLDISDFHIASSILKSEANNANIHIGLMPKVFLNEIVSACRSLNIEPYAIMTRATAISALYTTKKDLSKNSLIISLENNVLSLTACCNGLICYDRAIQFDPVEQLLKTELERHIQISIYSLEKQYGVVLDQIYTINANLFNLLKNSKIEREVSFLEIANKDIPNKALFYLSLATIFVQDFNPPTILTNYCCREFSYRLQFKELWRGIVRLLPYVALFLIIISVYMFGKYEMLNYRINDTRNKIQSVIQDYIPSLNKENKVSIEQVMQEHAELEKELKNLSTNAVMSPLEAFSLLSDDLNTILAEQKGDISISQIHITQKDAKFTIETSDYKGPGAVERQLKRRYKHQYCKIENKDKSSMHASRKTFEFIVEFCNR